jgi:transcriptional regulator with XRE-family HTH domain
MDMESRERLTALVKQARGNKSKSAFAELLGVSHTAVGSWEQGLFLPDVKSLVKISELLGLSVEQLLGSIEGRPLKESKSDLSRMVRQINSMALKELAVLDRALADRLGAIAESAGR